MLLPDQFSTKYVPLDCPLEKYRDVTVFLRVKNSTASGPCACRSPRNESFQPENGKNATGAATPMLTPTIPTSTSWRKWRTAEPDSVKIDTPLPKRLALTISIASSSESARPTDRTGPKIPS